jgi:CBS domain-containing protein
MEGTQGMQALQEIMTRDPVTLSGGMSLREAIEVLRAAGISGAPVLEGSHVVGVVSVTDILDLEASSPGVPPERREMLDFGEIDTPSSREDVEEAPGAYFVDRWFDAESDVWSRISETDSPEWDRMEEHDVAEVMSRKLVTLPPDAPVSSAARRMVDDRVHRVLVMEGDRLVGVVTTMDVVRSVAINP